MKEDLKVICTDAPTAMWHEKYNERCQMSDYVKPLYHDDETGMRVEMVLYPAGYVTKKHVHNCGHGMFVLEGIFKTSEGIFGPGSFVWFPEGIVSWHGATKEQACRVIFLSNKEFDITYLDEE